MSKKRFHLMMGAVAAGVAGAAHAAVVGNSISINFGADQDGANSAMVASDVAGLVPSANWNDAVGASGTLNNLVRDSNGVPSAIAGSSVTWSSNNLWGTNQEDNTVQAFAGADRKMMQGYIDVNVGTPSSINFAGLTDGTYNVIVYTLTAVNNRDSGNITVAGVNEKSITPPAALGVYAEGGGPGGADNVGGLPGNFNFYPNVLVSGGALSITMNAATFRTAVNGIQITEVPEPTALGFLGLAGALMMGRRRK